MNIFPVDWPAPGRLAVVSRPSADALEAELQSICDSGFGTLVSLLSEPEAAELGLAHEGVACTSVGLKFEWYPLADFSIPDLDSFDAALARLHDQFRAGEAIAAHCRGGIGRSPLLVASLLVLDGALPEDAWSRVSRARGAPVPDTEAQRRWLSGLTSRR